MVDRHLGWSATDRLNSMEAATMEGSSHGQQPFEMDKETHANFADTCELSPPRDASKAIGKETSRVIINPRVEEKPDEPPNGGYGWVCVACAFCINAHTWGLNSVRSGRSTND